MGCGQNGDIITIAFKIMLESNHKNRVSLQALIEQIENWQLTLGREQKKLRFLKGKLSSKILINQIEIIMTEIEGELIRYRKLKDANRLRMPNFDVIQDYNQNSKRFMDLMENIGNFADKVEADGPDLIGFMEGHEREGPSLRNKFQEETFAYSIAKQEKYQSVTYIPSKTISKTSTRKPSKQLQQKTAVKTVVGTANNSMSLKDRQKIAKTKPFQAMVRNPHTISVGSASQSTNGEIDSWQIRYQLKEIKSMMAQIQNEIKYHSHEDIEAELSKLQHNNKKMCLEMKGLRQDSQFILSRIQKLKQQLATEKQVQAQMIQQFEHPARMAQSRKAKAKSQTHSAENSRLRNNISHSLHQEQVSEWVRVRI